LVDLAVPLTGSVNGGNCAELAKEEDIDGFLVGGASLKVQALVFAVFLGLFILQPLLDVRKTYIVCLEGDSFT